MHWTLQAAQLATLHSCTGIEVQMDTLANVFKESINREGKEIALQYTYVYEMKEQEEMEKHDN